jgi:hypothetical protein
MEPIALSTGLRRRKNKKTVPLRVRSGRTPPGTSVTGEITARKASEFNIIRMEISTKACGLWTRSTDRALSGDKTLESWDVNTLVTGTKTDAMVVVPSSTPTEIVTMATGWMDSLKEKAVWFTQLKTFMRDNGTKVNATVTVSWLREMVTILKDTGSMDSVKARAVTSTMTKTSFLLESGVKINPRLESTLKSMTMKLRRDLRSPTSWTNISFPTLSNSS